MIVEICDYAADYSGNFILSLLNLAKKNRTLLNKETLFVFPEESKNKQWIKLIEEDKFKIVFINRNLSIRKQQKFFYKLFKDYEIKLAHTHFIKFDISVILSSKKMGIPVIWHVHNERVNNNIKQRIKDIIKYRILSRYVNRIICVSEPLRESLILRGSPSSKTIAIKNGIDSNRIDIGLNAFEEKKLKESFGFDENDFVITMFGWNPYVKGVDIAIEAGKILEKEEVKNFKLLIVGKENLRKFIESNANYKWLKLSDPLENVTAFYKVSDVFLSASRIEGFSYSVGEAMIARLPVISSNIPYVVENFKMAGKGFIVFENGDPYDLSKKIKQIMNIPLETRMEFGQSNREFVISNLSIDVWSDSILDIYKSILRE